MPRTSRSAPVALVLAIFLPTLFGCGATSATQVVFPLKISSIDGRSDTVRFHIGSPIVLEISNRSGRACAPLNGRFFVFGPDGTQLGWGFSEVTDSIALPRSSGDCRRYLMLSAEASNRLPEGSYVMSVALLVDAKERIVSDTLVIEPINAPTATARS